MKGLVCAGGEATRLGELTRVANKHLLPVGRWPMIYYPLQLLQRAGVREVLVVTGKGHAGQMIDLLGDGRLDARGTGEPLLELDLTYKVQTRGGRDRPGRGHGARLRRAARSSSSCSATTSSSTRRRTAIARWAAGADGALIFVKEVPDPENFGVVVYGGERRVTDIVEKAGVVDTRYERPPSSDAVVGLYCYPARRVRRDRPARAVRRAASSRSPTSTATTPSRAGSTSSRVRGLVGGRGQALAAPRRDRPARRRDRARTRVSVDGVVRIPLRRVEDERGWFSELRRESALPRPTTADEHLVLASRASSAGSTTTSAARTTSSSA